MLMDSDLSEVRQLRKNGFPSELSNNYWVKSKMIELFLKGYLQGKVDTSKEIMFFLEEEPFLKRNDILGECNKFFLKNHKEFISVFGTLDCEGNVQLASEIEDCNRYLTNMEKYFPVEIKNQFQCNTL